MEIPLALTSPRPDRLVYGFPVWYRVVMGGIVAVVCGALFLGDTRPGAFAWVVLVISLHKGAFHAEALRAGIEAVPAVTLEAASSLAFSRRQLLVRVQLPLAVRFALPSLTNNLVDLVKMTAVASAIAVGDVTYESIMIWSQRDNVLELLLLILLWFGLLTWLVSLAGRWLEQHLRMPGYGQ